MKFPEKLHAFLRLIRVEHGIMLALAVLISEFIVLRRVYLFSPVIILSLLVPFLHEMASFALYDFLDIKADKLNKRTDKPLVGGKISKQTAIYTVIFGYALSILLAYFLNPVCFAIALGFAALSIMYNYWLKDLPLLGNAYISASMAIPFIFGNLAVFPTLHPAVVSLSLIAFLGGMGREIIKSAEDAFGDRKARNSKTLPLVIGTENSLKIASLFYFAFILSTLLIFSFDKKPTLIPMLFVLAADTAVLGIALCLLRSRTHHNLSMARKLSLIAFIIGLVGVFLACL